MPKVPFTARLDGEVIRRMRLLAEAEGTTPHDVLREAAAAELVRFARERRRRGLPVPWDDPPTRESSSPSDSAAAAASSPTVSAPAKRIRARRSR